MRKVKFKNYQPIDVLATRYRKEGEMLRGENEALKHDFERQLARCSELVAENERLNELLYAYDATQFPTVAEENGSLRSELNVEKVKLKCELAENIVLMAENEKLREELEAAQVTSDMSAKQVLCLTGELLKLKEQLHLANMKNANLVSELRVARAEERARIIRLAEMHGDFALLAFAESIRALGDAE